MQQYQTLLQHILDKGFWKGNRTGIRTLGVHGYQMRFDLQKGFPLVTTKEVNLHSIIHELLWFLMGSTNIRYLVQNKVNIWNEWPFKYYFEQQNKKIEPNSKEWKEKIKMFKDRIIHDEAFAKKWGELGPVYGYQWRNWEYWIVYEGNIKKNNPNMNMQVFEDSAHRQSIDQITKLVKGLKENPEGRRHVVSAWKVDEIDEMAKRGLPPCHCLFQFHVRPIIDQDSSSVGEPRYALSCQLYQRSCDTFLGVPFNIASYALLTMMVAQVVNMVPDEFIWDGGDVHIYENHLDQVKKQLSREPKKLPKMKLNSEVKDIFSFKFEDFTLVGYEPHPAIKGEIAV